SLERAKITCNKNGIPFDSEKPMITSGIRFGTPAATTRGFDEAEFVEVGKLACEVLDGLAENPEDNSKAETSVAAKVDALLSRFPIYS
ncbi:MAG: serine hydroxymethyltransferase, partial [Rhodospirillaceae bacterium]|nr:serine hydroxymethyltransferase [Rhodospirillaceae bacterium]